MQELIKITDREGQQVVSARELHEFLGSKRQFGNWIAERITKYGFIEGEDYTTFNDFVKHATGQAKLTEYALTIDTAKELAMAEANAKGKEARQYFIACEKKLRTQQSTALALPGDYEEALTALLEKVKENKAKDVVIEQQQQQQQLTIAAPKVAAHDQLISSEGNILVGEAAKILNYEKLGPNQLFEYLRKTGVLIANANRKNEPYQCYVNRGFFKVVTRSFSHGASYKADTTTYVTPAGLVYLKRRIEKAGYKPRQIKTLKQATTTINNVSTAIKQLGGSFAMTTNFLPL